MRSGLYVPLDVTYYTDENIVDAGEAAEVLYMRALCFAKTKQTDGALKYNQLHFLGLDNLDARIQRLLDTGLWQESAGGYQITAWLKHNPPASEVQELRAKRQQAGRKGAQARLQTSTTEPAPAASDSLDLEDIPNPLPVQDGFDAQGCVQRYVASNSRRPISQVILQQVVQRLHRDPSIAQQLGRQLTEDDIDAMLRSWAERGKPASPQALIPNGTASSQASWGEPWWAVRLNDGLTPANGRNTPDAESSEERMDRLLAGRHDETTR